MSPAYEQTRLRIAFKLGLVLGTVVGLFWGRMDRRPR